MAMLAARTKKITSKRLTDPLIEDGQILARLVCYTSKLVGVFEDVFISSMALFFRLTRASKRQA